MKRADRKIAIQLIRFEQALYEMTEQEPNTSNFANNKITELRMKIIDIADEIYTNSKKQ